MSSELYENVLEVTTGVKGKSRQRSMIRDGNARQWVWAIVGVYELYMMIGSGMYDNQLVVSCFLSSCIKLPHYSLKIIIRYDVSAITNYFPCISVQTSMYSKGYVYQRLGTTVLSYYVTFTISCDLVVFYYVHSNKHVFYICTKYKYSVFRVCVPFKNDLLLYTFLRGV